MRLLIFSSILLICFTVSGQLKFSESNVKIFSNHFWRGNKLGTGTAIEPSVSFVSGKFGLNFWVAYTPNKSYSEIDIIPSWSFEKFTFTVFNYYNPVIDAENNYFEFTGKESRHSIELAADNYNNGNERLKWMIGAFIFGDKDSDTNKPLYSSYLEIKYPVKIFAKITVVPVFGLTPFKGFYANKPAVVNAGITFNRDLNFNLPFKIPLELSFISNPYAKKNFIVFASGIAL